MVTFDPSLSLLFIFSLRMLMAMGPKFVSIPKNKRRKKLSSHVFELDKFNNNNTYQTNFDDPVRKNGFHNKKLLDPHVPRQKVVFGMDRFRVSSAFYQVGTLGH